MRKFRMLMVLFVLTILTSCTTVESGHTGVKIIYGGETDMNQIYPEGMYSGFSWLWNSMKEYETRERTLTISDVYLDKDGLKIPIDAVVYFQAQSGSVNKLHKQIGPDYIDRKIRPAMNAALKNVIPQYSALELNNTYRKEAELNLVQSLKERFPKFFVDLIGVELTKVDIPKRISDQIVEKQVQDERNTLAEKKKLEEENLAKARIAKAEGNYKASIFDKKTKENMSSPRLLELYRAETERKWAEKGISQYGSNNVFGTSDFLKIKK